MALYVLKIEQADYNRVQFTSDDVSELTALIDRLTELDRETETKYKIWRKPLTVAGDEED